MPSCDAVLAPTLGEASLVIRSPYATRRGAPSALGCAALDALAYPIAAALMLQVVAGGFRPMSGAAGIGRAPFGPDAAKGAAAGVASGKRDSCATAGSRNLGMA